MDGDARSAGRAKRLSSKPTYEEVVCEFEDLLNVITLGDGSLFKPLLGADFLKVRDAVDKARRIVSLAKGWESRTLAEEVAQASEEDTQNEETATVEVEIRDGAGNLIRRYRATPDVSRRNSWNLSQDGNHPRPTANSEKDGLRD